MYELSSCEVSRFVLGSYEPADPMVLETLVVGKEAIKSLRQALIGRTQYRLLGFWSKAILSVAENDIF